MKQISLLLFLLISLPSFSQSKNHSNGFKENKGQIIDQKGKPNNTVKYLLNTSGLNVQLKKNGFSYDIYEVKKNSCYTFANFKDTSLQDSRKRYSNKTRI